jgi:phosphoribosyl-AMP cyclohydrolase / phosphoribosyl-ATP pyrophosphohydrolase
VNDLVKKIDWDKSGNGLVPAVVQDSSTARVRMLGYMNREALEKTIATGKVTFFGRTKQELWVKGETSGNFLLVDDIKVDCDNDTLLITARPQGPTCHKGTETCFGDDHAPDFGFLGALEDTITARARDGDPEKSYVARMMAKTTEKMAQKVGEEGVETALAAMTDDRDHLLDEAADLVFHLMILLKSRKLSLRDVASVLENRHKLRDKKP